VSHLALLVALLAQTGPPLSQKQEAPRVAKGGRSAPGQPGSEASSAGPSQPDSNHLTTLTWVGEHPFFYKKNACGLNACYILLRLTGKDAKYERLRTQVPITERGASLDKMAEALRSYELDALCVRANPSLLDGRYFPCIVHTEPTGKDDLGHYYVALRRSGPHLVVEDPTTQAILKMEWTSFLEVWSGNAIVIRRGDSSAARSGNHWLVVLVWASLGIQGAGIIWQCQLLWTAARSHALYCA